MKTIFQSKLIKLFVFISVFLSITACPRPDDELMNKEYSYEEIQNEICDANRKHCVELGNALYFIEEGFLFKFDKNLNRKEYAKGFDVKEIVEYGGAAVALQEDGDIYLQAYDDKGRSEFVSIGNRAVSIESNNLDLVALVNGTVWAYRGEPGDLRITYNVTFISNGQGGLTTITTPTVGGREVAFEKSEFTNVRSVDKEGNSIIIQLESGDTFSPTLIWNNIKSEVYC